jgi:hypothetical protein
MICDFGLSGHVHITVECQLKLLYFHVHESLNSCHEIECWGILCNSVMFSICIHIRMQTGNNKRFSCMLF